MQPEPPVEIPKPPAPPAEPKPQTPTQANEEVDYDPMNLPKPPAPEPQDPPAPPAEEEDDAVDYNPLSFTTNSYKPNEAPAQRNYNQNSNMGYGDRNADYNRGNSGYQREGDYRGNDQRNLEGNKINYGLGKRGPMGNADELFSRSIFISGLNYDSREEDIFHLFSQCGEIQEMNIPKYQDTQRNIGYGHLTFSSPEEKAKVH